MGAFNVTTGPAENPVKCSAQRGNHLAVGGDETQLQVYDMNAGQKGCLFKVPTGFKLFFKNFRLLFQYFFNFFLSEVVPKFSK